ncbi:MAG: glycerol-3-phosphate 1-O-acyltransferase PlsY [Victivallaceae bacterium]|nr:glycerol-3-phosphate 1-O-acyltransferase PlsY [Victivallaceae bacterium]
MNDFLWYSGIVMVSYLFGAVPWGLLIGFMYGKDVRLEGSGNIGATNVTRVVGKTQGKICFALDFLKGFFPVLVMKILLEYSVAPDLPGSLAAAAAMPVVGHMFPVFIGFRGGKGVSTAAGAVFGMAPPACLAALAVWGAVFFIWRYVSLASIAAAAVVPIAATLFNVTGVYSIPASSQILLWALGAAAILRHHSNIVRLLNGTENRFSR